MAQFGDGGVHVAGEVVHPPMQLTLEGGQPSFRALQSRLRRAGRRDADFRKAVRVRAQLARRLLVEMPQRRPLLLDDALECLESRRRVALQARFDLVPSGEARLELTHRQRVAFAGGGPLFEHVGALIGELREPPLHRLQVILRVAPVLQRNVEASDLRLELGEAMFQPLSLQFHGFPRVAPMIVRKPRRAQARIAPCTRQSNAVRWATNQ
jgi:hypothetical protein